MTKRLSEGYLARLRDAVVAEIKAQMGRRGVGSSRALADLIGANSQWMSQRLDGGNKHGERVVLTISDLSRIASALNIDPAVLLERAVVEAGPIEYADELAALRAKKSDLRPTVSDEELYDEPSAAEPKRDDDGTKE